MATYLVKLEAFGRVVEESFEADDGSAAIALAFEKHGTMAALVELVPSEEEKEED
jgi:hypothetical protein